MLIALAVAFHTRDVICTYSPLSTDNIMLLAVCHSRTENQDAMDTYVVATLGDPSHSHIWTLGFHPVSHGYDPTLTVAPSAGMIPSCLKGSMPNAPPLPPLIPQA
jgi:hypothetical protein